MLRYMLKSKMHRATVTEANLNYIGSISIDKDLMKKSDLMENEKVTVLNINNGARFETYVQQASAGSGKMCLNGAAARLVQVEDKIIVLSYGLYEKKESETHKPIILLFDDNENKSYCINK